MKPLKPVTGKRIFCNLTRTGKIIMSHIKFSNFNYYLPFRGVTPEIVGR
jgi:hypothetical protein